MCYSYPSTGTGSVVTVGVIFQTFGGEGEEGLPSNLPTTGQSKWSVLDTQMKKNIMTVLSISQADSQMVILSQPGMIYSLI